MCTSGMFHSTCSPQIMAFMKHFKRIEPSRIQNVLCKPDCLLARLMPSSAIEIVKASAVYETK